MLVHANAPWTPKRRRELIGRVESKELSVEEAAQLGGVSQRTVYRWLARRRAGDHLLEDRASTPHRLPIHPARAGRDPGPAATAALDGAPAR